MRPSDAIAAMRADLVPAPQDRGVWHIRRRPVLPPFVCAGGFEAFPAIPPVVTLLLRWTDGTRQAADATVVMSDEPRELRRHLPVVLTAAGRVLVTGLGLGCVVRGLLANPAVTHIDVIEISEDVLAMVGPSFADEPRVAIHQGDALRHRWPRGARWDVAWHDVWGEAPHTHHLHARLLARYQPRAQRQGAWGLPRWVKRRWPWPLLGAGVRRRSPAPPVHLG
jgi:hypothetical protein